MSNKRNNMLSVGAIVVSLMLSSSLTALAEETTTEKTETKINEGVDSTKRTYRDAKDKVCEMVNGKMECLPKNLKHKGENLKDSIGTKARETKNKVD